ncbi:hypothetical protein [Cytobacillus massiliigabonensis]|uniref:hypothetical protein n=1 Tax=Cytobacillus massiliigabonensis TaxID=1871011 RepID=UPI000C85918D|nr:hypothetical protein [Cytobacillus massiliigabonensis]
MNNVNNDQQSALFRALQAGKLRELVSLRGGTGDNRRELSVKERQSRKAKSKEAKASRQFNRRKGA